MIQCPICQMINEDQTRFCAECGARLGPSPAPQAQAQAPQTPLPPQAPPPVQKLHSPILDNAGASAPQQTSAAPNLNRGAADPAEMDRLKRIGNRPEVPQTDGVARNPFDPRNQAQLQQDAGAGQASPPQDKPVVKLRSPLLAGEEDDYDEPAPGPLSARAKMGGAQAASGARPHLHSPLLGDAVEHHAPDMSAAGTAGRHGLHSPLLGDAAGHGELASEDYPAQPAGRPLHSPLLGDAGAHGVHHDPPQMGSGRHQLHSPLLGGAEDDYYEEQAPARGGLHSPILGGGSPSRGGLRSPILGGAASPQDPYYDDDYDDDPYADEDNPNILRSPLLSAKMPLEHEQAPQPKQARSGKPHPGVAGAPPGFYKNAASQQQAPQAAAPSAPAFQPQQQHPQTAAPSAPAFQPQQQPPQAAAPAQAPAFQPQQQAPQAGAPSAPAFQPQQQAPQAAAPSAPAFQPQQQAPQAAAPSAPAFQPQQAPPDADSTGVEEFPDMTRYRRGDAPPAPAPSPVVPVSVPILPDPDGFIPPEASPTRDTARGSQAFIPPQASAPLLEPPEPKPAPDLMQSKGIETPPPAKPLKRSSSKLLADSYEDEESKDFGAPASSVRGPGLAPYAPASPSSPLPKLLGAMAILLALLKLPYLLTYLPAISNPQYTWQTIDIAASTIALFLLGLAAIMSKN